MKSNDKLTPALPKKQPGKVFDVQRPGKALASPTSRPVIVGHKPAVQDSVASVSGLGVAKDSGTLLNKPRRQLKIQPDTPATPQSVDEQSSGAPFASPSARDAAAHKQAVEETKEALAQAAMDASTQISVRVSKPKRIEPLADSDLKPGAPALPVADAATLLDPAPELEAAPKVAVTQPEVPEARMPSKQSGPAAGPEPASAPESEPAQDQEPLLKINPELEAELKQPTKSAPTLSPRQELVPEQPPAPTAAPEKPAALPQEPDEQMVQFGQTIDANPESALVAGESTPEAPKDTQNPQELQTTERSEFTIVEHQIVVSSHGGDTTAWKVVLLLLVILALAAIALDILLDGGILNWPVPHTKFFTQ